MSLFFFWGGGGEVTENASVVGLPNTYAVSPVSAAAITLTFVSYNV